VVAYVVNDEQLSESESMVFTDIGLSNSILYTGQVEHKSKIIALLKAKDKTGHESAIVMSRSLYIDATPPVIMMSSIIDYSYYRRTIIKHKSIRTYFCL
jgi:hypothetical protein